MVNIARVVALRDHLIVHPEELDMDIWGKRTPCGTTACLAGHALLMFGEADGYRLHWNPNMSVMDVTGPGELRAASHPSCSGWLDPAEVAGKILGFSFEEGSLFYLENDEIMDALNELIEGST